MSRKKGINKVKVGFSIDKDVIEEFNTYCEVNSINKSKLISKILSDFINEKIYQNN
jgi:metal-responsive CopG/Arc/MetJ family transcriptional regulator